MLQQFFADLDRVGETRSVTDKVAILEEIKVYADDLLKEVIYEVFNPYHTYGITVKPYKGRVVPDAYDDSRILSEWCELTGHLKRRELTGNDAKAAVQDFLALCGSYTDWFVSLLNRNMRVGVRGGVVDRIYPGYINWFLCNLCSEYTEGDLEKMGAPAAAVKLDGVRCFIGCFEPGISMVRTLSRNGQPLYNTDHIIAALSHWAQDYVIDCEVFTETFEKTASITRTQTVHPNARELTCRVIAAIPLGEWHTKQASPMRNYRSYALKIADSTGVCIQYIPHEEVRTHEDVQQLMDLYFENGYEGVVLYDLDLPYQFARKGWKKWKPVETHDFRIKGVWLGMMCTDTGEIFAADEVPNDGREYVHCVRAISVDTGEMIASVGSGFSREQRIQFRDDFMSDPDRFLSYQLEVKYQGKTPDGSLRFPRFLRLRTDK